MWKRSPLETVVDRIMCGEIRDGKTIIGILKTEKHLERIRRGELRLGKTILVVDDEKNIVDILSST